jgi:cytochrome c biogenesis protein CcdA
MFEIVTKFASYLENVTFLTYPITIFLGFLSGMTAITCFAPLVPAIAGFVLDRGMNNRRIIVLPLNIMLGSITALAVLGVVVSIAGLTLQKSLGIYWGYFIGAVCIIMGLFVLGVVKIPTNIKIPKIKQKGFIAPFLFGVCMGGLLGFGSSCCLPILPVVLTYAAIAGKPIHGALILTSFAIGQSIPLFAIGLFSQVLGRFASRWSVYVRYIAGILLLVAGVYFILKGGRL